MQKHLRSCRINHYTTLRGTSKRKNKISTTYKAAFLTPTQENRNAAFFMPSCYAVRANKALIYEKHGQPLEVVIKNIIQTKLTRPKVRPYQTENLYALLEKQRALEKEVSAIVKRTDKKDAGSRRKQAYVTD